MESYQISLIIAILLGIGEVMTLTLLFLSMSIGMLVVSIIQFISGYYAFNRDLMIWVIVSSLIVFLLRAMFKKQTDQKKLDQDDINHY